MHKSVYAVIGAGSGGQAMAGCLALQGHEVRLFNRSPLRLAPLWRRGGITLTGSVAGFARPSLVTTDLEAAVSGARVLMVVVPATAHRELAEMLAPLVQPGQIIVLNPGRTGGALEVRHALTEDGAPRGVIVAEAQTLLFASRAEADGTCRVFSVKRFVPLAALPADDTPRVLAALNPAFPQFYAASCVLETGLDNMGAVFHPGVTLLNAAHIEATGGEFDYYLEGITPTVARIIEQIDSERVDVARAYGVRARSALDWLGEAYGAEGATLREAVLNNPGYAGIRAPAHLNHRYIWEDVPASLVPISALGRIAGIGTPTINAMIALASAMHDTDYRREGRNAARMGIAGRSPSEVLDLVREGDTEVDEAIFAVTSPAAGDLPG
ncbi:MAG: NAD/NADP octopine/nopaline dehydrogenase family protein [Bacillota bacterium]|nr:NAD/NADP octopine/nopaline dehydrogenase family protein [Bacillota bacterium]